MSGTKIFRIVTWAAVAVVVGIWIGFSCILPGIGRVQGTRFDRHAIGSVARSS